MLFYVAGPLTHGDVLANIRNAIDVGTHLLGLGHTAFVPHLSNQWHLIHPQPYETWMKLCLDQVPRCDGLLRIPGLSAGADREVKRAEECGILVATLEGVELKHVADALATFTSRQMKQADARALAINVGGLPKLTCDDCAIADVCEYAFDAYNTDGDCLADK